MRIFANFAPLYWGANIPAMPLKMKSKAPILSEWTQYGTNMPSSAVRDHWLHEYPRSNIGLPFGPASGLCAIDIDTTDPVLVAAIEDCLPVSPWRRVGAKGCALVFKWQGQKNFKIRSEEGMLCEFLGLGNQMVLPPSIHPDTGEAYVANCNLWEVMDQIPALGVDIEQRLKDALGLKQAAPRKRQEVHTGKKSGIGGRHPALASELGRLRNKGVQGEALRVAALEYDRSQHSPPLHETDPAEFERLVHDAGQWEGSLPFVRNDSGRILPFASNLSLALTDMGVSVSHNEFTGRSHVEGLDGFGPELIEDAINRIRMEVAERYGFIPPKDWLFDAIRDLALRAKFHPVREMLSVLQVKWDGVARLDTWLSTYGGADDTPFVRAVGALTLIAAVRRVREPGCKFDTMLVLEGSQGSSKSSAISILAMRAEWFADHLPFHADGREVIEHLTGIWLMEAGELTGLGRADVAKVKALLSRGEDRGRAAYARQMQAVKRQCIFIGTTNDSAYLADSTGNRRFLPVRAPEFDLEALKEDREQLWAEAATREADGESIVLPKSLWSVSAEEQEARRLESPVKTQLAHFLDGRTGRLSMVTLWKLLDVPITNQNALSKLVTEAMTELGWVRCKRRFGGANPQSGYAKGDDLQQMEILKGPCPH